MKLVNLAYKAYVILTELKISLLNAQECKKECNVLKIAINDLKNKIDEIEDLVENYCKDEKIDSLERVIEEYIAYIIENMEDELQILKGSNKNETSKNTV